MNPWNTFNSSADLADASGILNLLPDATLSAVSEIWDNTSNADTHAYVEVLLGSITPTGNPYLELHAIKKADGTNFEQSPILGGANRNTLIHRIPVTTGAGIKRVLSPLFLVTPHEYVFYIGNVLNVSTAATGNTLRVFSGN